MHNCCNFKYRSYFVHKIGPFLVVFPNPVNVNDLCKQKLYLKYFYALYPCNKWNIFYETI